ATLLGSTTISPTERDANGNLALAPGSHTLVRTTSDLGFPTDRASQGLSRKDYFLVARIDSSGVVAESSESNNDATYTGVSRVSGASGVFIQGGNGGDTVTVRKSGSNVVVGFNGTTFSYRKQGVGLVVARLHGGDDNFDGRDSEVGLTAWGGAGNDLLQGGKA